MKEFISILIFLYYFNLYSFGQNDSLSTRLQYGIGIETVNLSNFDNKIISLDHSKFPNKPMSIETNAISFKYKRIIFFGPVSITGYDSQNYSDTTVNSFGWKFGINLGLGIIDNDNFLLFPYIGYATYNYRYSFIVNSSQTLSGILSSSSENKHINFIRNYYDLGIQCDFKFKKKKKEFFFLKGGILLFPSETKIIVGGNEIYNDLDVGILNTFYIKVGYGFKNTIQ